MSTVNAEKNSSDRESDIENDELELKAELSLNAEFLDIKESDKTMLEKIGDLLRDFVTDLLRDFEESVHASEVKMTKLLSSNNKAVMLHVDKLNNRVKNVETSIAALPDFMKVVSENMKETSHSLKEISGKVALNTDDIRRLNDAVGTLRTEGTGAVATTASTPNSSNNGTEIVDALAKQTRFNTAIAMGQSPTMYFSGEPHKYVQFITRFRGSFEETINDPVALYEILLRHTK